MSIKSKKVLLAGWGCENPQDTYAHQIYYLVLKRIFPQLETFDTKKVYFQFGKRKMNNDFLLAVEKYKPDLIIFSMDNDEFDMETLFKINEDYRDTKKIILICDDDARFDSWSRYYALLFDGVIQSPPMQKEYQKDGYKNSFFHFDYNNYKLEPLNIKKEYDLTFIGRPKADRCEIIKFLKENGIKVGLFGWGWSEHPEFKDIYKGPLSQEDYAKVINQSKISLNFTKAGFSEETKRYNMKGRFFEVALCRAFQLIEYYPGVEKFFKDRKEVVYYKTKEELLEKIKYYLKHEEVREKIAENAYKKTLTKYNRENHLKQIFEKVFHSRKGIDNLPEIKKKVITLTKEDFELTLKQAREKLKKIDCVTFSVGNHENSDYKNYFHLYSLEKTRKDISCCDYYVYSKNLGNYLLFASKFAFSRLGDKANNLIDLNQLMVTKDYFLKNFNKFKKIISHEKHSLINGDNTVFISIPLTRIKKINTIDYESMKKSFEMKFINDLFSLIYQKKLLTSKYAYFLLLNSLFGKRFIIRYIIESIKAKSNWDKLKVNKIYTTRN